MPIIRYIQGDYVTRRYGRSRANFCSTFIDVKTAQLIQDMMRTRFAGRTRLIITHELYNARGADKVLVLDQGRIVQSGTHAELLTLPGLYRFYVADAASGMR